MRKQVDIYGEYHTPEERARIEKLIMAEHSKNKYMYLLLEDIGPHRYVTKESKEKAIRDQMYSIGPQGLEFSIILGIPAIGIDYWGALSKRTSESFRTREKRMVDVISQYRMVGRCAVIVGDTHLRTITTRELGAPSLIHKAFKSDRYVKIIRSPMAEIK